MPAVDALAADSVIFERAYTHSPLMLPAHASLLAGQLPFEHGVRDDAGYALKADTRSLAELLRNRGFETGAAVSSFVLRRESGVAKGFSFFDADLAAGSTDRGPVVERDAAMTIAAVERWVRAREGQRFFLFVQVSQSSADAAVARLVDLLKEQKLYDEATIVLTADVGEPRSDVLLDDTALRVPLTVKQPNSDGAGRRVGAPVQHIDILPTVLDLVRAPVPSGLRGRSLRGVLNGDDGLPLVRPIYAESLVARFKVGGHAVFALGQGSYRYIRGSSDALVDLEQGTITSPPPEIPEAAELRVALDRMLEGHVVEAPEEILAADEDEYAALGYLGGAAIAEASVLAIDPGDEAGLIASQREAALLVGQKNYRAAIDRLRAITRTHPENAVVHYQLGMLLERTGRLEESAEALRAAAALQPDNPYLAAQLARVALRAERFEDARARAGLAVALAERRDARARAVAHEIAARVALAQHEAEKALQHAAAAQTEDPANPVPEFVRGRFLYDEGNYEAALEVFEEAETLASQHGRSFEDLHWYLGDTLSHLERYQDAEAHFHEELRAFPRSVRTYSSLTMLYSASNRDQAAEDVIARLMETAPTPEGYATAARLWTILGERARADAIRADARARFRGDPTLSLLGRDVRQ